MCYYIQAGTNGISRMKFLLICKLSTENHLTSLLFDYHKASNNLTAMCYFNHYFRIFNSFSVIFLTTNMTIIKFSVYQIFIGKVDVSMKTLESFLLLFRCFRWNPTPTKISTLTLTREREFKLIDDLIVSTSLGLFLKSDLVLGSSW